MALTVGTRIGPFLVKSSLGEGGMGVVFRALDTKLQRDVALKLLPDHFADDPERLARFQREAQVLASLNHPNIAQIYGLEESDNTRCIVMELVEGETLQERLKRGPISIDDALLIAKQIAEALEAAHEKGIVHRDLKPANIKLTGGKVKVLDFGLAKAFQDEHATTLSNSPTLMSASVPGVILGTAAYMSPEQAKGKESDRTTDLWAFGCVLYEMLTGSAVFRGETIGEILAEIFKADPDWTRLPAATPTPIRRLLRRCLQKDPALRLRDAGDARIEIHEALSNPEQQDYGAPVVSRSRERLAWTVAVLALLAGAITAGVGFVIRAPVEPPEMRLQIATPPTTDLQSLALSPDGRRLVFSATVEGKTQLWMRPLDSVAAQPMAGTENAEQPFWSPDGRSLGFFADGKLKRIDISGGAVQMLADVPLPRGGTWNSQGTILYATGGGSAAGGLYRVPDVGGPSVQVKWRDPSVPTLIYPHFLPEGSHFVATVGFGAGPALYVTSLDGDARRLITGATGGGYLPSDHLLFVRQNVLFAQRFDARKLQLIGDPAPVAEQLATTLNGTGGFSAAARILVLRPGSTNTTDSKLAWFDRSGKELGSIAGGDGFQDVELSPDEKRIVSGRAVPNSDIWIVEIGQGIKKRFTFGPQAAVYPIWSPDGNSVVFSSLSKSRTLDLYQKSATGTGPEELLLESSQAKQAFDWSPDGRFIIYRTVDPNTNYDLWILPLHGDRKPFPFLATPSQELDAQFSPDARWVAYASNESGRFETYVQPFPGPGGKWQVSNNGGAQPRWRRDGKELFYVAADSKLMAVPVNVSTDSKSFEIGKPQSLFTTHMFGGGVRNAFRHQYDVSKDGQRFLINTVPDEASAMPILVILNWKPKP